MSLWRELASGLRVLVNRAAADREIEDEVGHFLEQSAAAYEAKGLSPEEARRAARLDLGNPTNAREQVRMYGWENHVATWCNDIGYAARRLGAKPGFLAISLLTLALGIGASTAIFSVIEGVLLKPLPYASAERLVALVHTAPGIHIETLNMAASLYLTYREENRVFEDVGMWSGDSWTVTGAGDPEQATGVTATHRFLNTLGVNPVLGRGFTASDEQPESERVILLADGYWRARFGGDPSVLGRRILLDGNAYTVIGVLPASFQFLDLPVQIVAPVRFRRAEIRLIGFCCQGVARLKPGVTLAQADADVARMLPLAALKFPMNPGFARNAFIDARIAPRLRPLKDSLVGDVGGILWVLMGTVGIVLSIACANVANLMLVRADGRRQELAIRTALGAGAGRIARELLLESLLLGIGGGALGLLLAYGAVRVLVASELQFPRLREVSVDPVVLGFALAVSLVSGLLFGLLPVFKYARPAVSAGLRAGSRSLTGSRERHRARTLLVVTQMALALVLLVASGLMVRSFQALRRVDPGFSLKGHVETVRIGIPDAQVKEPERVMRMQEAMLRKMEGLAGVSAAAMTNALPLDGGSTNPVYAEDRPTPEGSVPPIRRFKFVSPGYAAAIGSRLLAGREFTWNDVYQRAPLVLISENMARELWRDPHAALGKRIRGTLNEPWSEVIGVLGDLHDNGIEQPAPTVVYWPLLRKAPDGRDLAVRALTYVLQTPRAGSSALRQELREAVSSVNADLPLARVRTLDAVYQRSLIRTSLTLALLAIAGSMALLLGVVGIYGVISYSVSQRTREVGIRLALGAPVEGVAGLFVKHGLAMAVSGAACGLVAALALTRLMKSLLFGVSPADPLTYLAAAAALVLAAAGGSYLPARRAARVDPVEALRAE